MSTDCSIGRAAAFTESARRGLVIDAVVPCSRSMCVFGFDECAVAGSIASDFADSFLSVPVVFAPDTRVPGWVDGGTFAVLVSGSGGRSEIEGLMESLSERGASFACVSPEGLLQDRCQSLGGVPIGISGESPAGFAAGAVIAIMDMALSSDASAAMIRALDDAEGFATASAGRAEALAESLKGRVPAVYSTSDITACSRWWRLRMGDAGGLSFSGELPEFNHNELVGWSDPNVHAPELEAVILRGSGEPPLVEAVVGCMIEVLEENGRRTTVVDLGGGDCLTTDVRGIVLGTMVSEAMRGGSRWTYRSSTSSTISWTTSSARSITTRA